MALLINACSGTLSKLEPAAPVRVQNKEFTAQGRSAIKDDPNLPPQQLKRVAEQSARMNAYRALATRLYHEKLPDGTTVAARVMRDEAYRIYVDIYLREANLTALQAWGGWVSANMALIVNARFYHCMGGDVVTVQQCLLQDNKVPLTRLGDQIAEIRQVNLMCGQADCTGLYHVGGFDRRLDDVDQLMLNAGLYDREWLFNTGGRLFSNALIIQGLTQH